MYCMSCGQEISEGARFCPECGTRQEGVEAASELGGDAHLQSERTSGRPTSDAAPANAGVPQHQALSFDAARWSRGDRLVGGACLLLLIALFLPWFSLSVGGVSVGGGFGVPGLSLDAVEAHGWMYLVLLVALAILGDLFARAMRESVRPPVAHRQLLVGATGLNLFLAVIAFIATPGGTGYLASVGYQWSYGAFIGLVAAIGALVGALMTRPKSETTFALAASTPTPAAPGMPSTSTPEVSSSPATTLPPSPPPASPVPSVASEAQPAAMSQEPMPAIAPSAAASQDAMIDCRGCGCANPTGNRFCNSCGATLGSSTASGGEV